MRLSGILAEKGFHAFDYEPAAHAGHKIPRVWILIADKGYTHIWRKGADGFQEIACVEFQDELNKSLNHQHHIEEIVAEKLSGWLEQARDEDVFDRLVLVASKRMLGTLREKLPTDILACIAAEVPKDLTNLGKRELEEALHKMIVI